MERRSAAHINHQINKSTEGTLVRREREQLHQHSTGEKSHQCVDDDDDKEEEDDEFKNAQCLVSIDV